MHPRLKYLSTYAGIAAWGASGFMANPTIASGVYHLTVLPVLIAITIWLAHREGARTLAASGAVAKTAA